MSDNDDAGHTEGAHDPSERGMIPSESLNLRTGINWKLWFPIIVLLITFPVVWTLQRHARARKLHTQLLQEHKKLTGGLAPEYIALRKKIESLTFSALAPYEGPYTAPGFNYETLAKTSVIYGRVRAGEIRQLGDVEASIRHRYPDQIAACMGVNAVWVPEYYRRGDFLLPSWAESVGTIDDADRLAALRADLLGRVRNDWPDLVDWSRRKTLIIAVDEGNVSIAGPTRVYIWDLNNDALLARTRGDGAGTEIVPVHIAGASAESPPAEGNFNVSIHDCAVANVMRAQLGQTGMGAFPH